MNIEHDNTKDASAKTLGTGKHTQPDDIVGYDNSADISAKKRDSSKNTHSLNEGTLSDFDKNKNGDDSSGDSTSFEILKNTEFHERGEESYISEQIASEKAQNLISAINEESAVKLIEVTQDQQNSDNLTEQSVIEDVNFIIGIEEDESSVLSMAQQAAKKGSKPISDKRKNIDGDKEMPTRKKAKKTSPLVNNTQADSIAISGNVTTLANTA
jgi:hypothetical protein